MKTEINWVHWRQLRRVKVWEACLLSLNFDPARVQPELAAALFVQTASSHQVIRSICAGSFSSTEYLRRLRVICSYLEQVESFSEVVRVVANENTWEVSLHEFCLLADRIGLDLPPALTAIFVDLVPAANPIFGVVTVSTEESANALISEAPDDWQIKARELGAAEKKRAPQLSLIQIATNVEKQMQEMHGRGDKNVTGRGNRVPSAETIRRHALGNLST
jgi:hypothetical protein